MSTWLPVALPVSHRKYQPYVKASMASGRLGPCSINEG